MVIVISTSYFPANKSAEVGKKYLEVSKQFPPDKTRSKELVPVAVRITPEGMKSMVISEVKEGKLREFLEVVYQQILIYSKIEGYRANIEVYMSGVEALPLVGLKMPE
jgi:hypothetical protein